MKYLPFTGISTAAGVLFALFGSPAFSSAETVGIYFDPTTPQIEFDAGDSKAALQKRKHTVQTHDLAALSKADSGKKNGSEPVCRNCLRIEQCRQPLFYCSPNPALAPHAHQPLERTLEIGKLGNWVLTRQNGCGSAIPAAARTGNGSRTCRGPFPPIPAKIVHSVMR